MDIANPAVAASPVPDSPAASHRLLELQRRALESVIRGAPLPAVLEDVCRIIEAVAEDHVAAAISLVEDGRLVHGAAPRLSDAYNALIDGIPVDPELGTCPVAAARRETVITPDIEAEPRWAPFKAHPLADGWRAVWSMPVLGVDGDVLATIGTYFRSRRGPTAAEQDLVATLARTAGLAIERARADERLRRQGARSAFLAGLERELQGLGEAHAVIDAAAARLADFLDADRCTYATAEPGDVLVVRGDCARNLPPVDGRWPLAAFGDALASALKAGRTYVVRDSDRDLEVDPAIREAFERTRVRASITVPLVKSGQLTAVLGIQQARPRDWTRDEIEVAEQVVARCWEAVERARVAHELRESEARYRAIVEATPECVKLVAPDGTVLQMNEAGLRMVGAAAAGDVVGRRVFGLIAPESLEAYRTLHAAVCAGESRTLEYALVALDGTRRWMDTTAVPLPWPGEGHAHLAITRDVSPRVLADRALADSRARLDYAVRLSGIGFWYCDLPFDELIWDERVKAHFHLPPDARVTIDTFYERLHPDDREPTRAAIERSIADRTPYDVVYRTVDPASGAVHWVRALGGTSYADDGHPIRFDGVTVDVTASKRDQDRLAALLDREREQGRLLSEVAQAARTIYAATSVESVLRVITEEARRIVGAHQAVASLTRDSNWAQAVVSVSLSDKYARFRDYEVAPSDQGIYTLVCETNAPIRLTEAELREHPRWRDFSGEAGAHPPLRGWLAVPLTTHDGGNMGLVQLSDRYSGEFSETDEAILVQLAQIGSVALENTRLYERLRDQDRRKDEFIATLAHELRNPLAPIRTGVALLRREDGSAARGEVLAMMERQLHGLVRLVDDLLDVSRITHGKITLAREATDVRDAVRAAVEIARPLVAEHRHRLDVDVPGEGLQVSGDPARLAQILSNLLNNAARYTPPGGRIGIRAARDGADVLVQVTDNGIGIPPGQLARVFDLFAQVDAPGAAANAGRGIGLTLVRRLVELHGGTVEVASAGAGAGSTFTVRLPGLAQQVPAGTPPEAASAAAVDAGGLRILVVDDNRDAADTLRMLLEMDAHVVEVASDGPSALEQAARFRPDVVFLDIGLPGMNGFDVAARLRATDPSEAPALIALTGWGTEEDRRRAREVGFIDHLVKPVDPQRLLGVLHGIAHRRAAPA